MSSKNYDVELNLTYDNQYRHYIPTYTVKAPYFHRYGSGSSGYTYDHNYFISLDEEAEVELGYSTTNGTAWAIDGYPKYGDDYQSAKEGNNLIPDSGVFNKIYFRNPHRDRVAFSLSDCDVKVIYQTKATFEVQWNSTGFASNQNATFRCSTIQKNTYKQYEWASATVYYKKTTAVNYQSVAGTISGSWSDTVISTNITLEDGYTYDVYITAVSDDNETATTPVAQFSSTDGMAVATCVSPSGAFTSGYVIFVWSHATAYGTPQFAYDLQYSNNNGSTWTTVANHKITQNTTDSATLTDAGVYKWRVRTYNSNDIAGDWAEATFVNQVPANPPINVQVNTKGRPTVTWASISQSAYQVQFLLGDAVVYDSGAVYTSETTHFVNQYFDDTRSYTVRVRVYNALGEISVWVSTGYQQPSISDVDFAITANAEGGATITITPSNDFEKYYVLRNNKLIAQVENNSYTDYYAVGITNYSVVGVTGGDQSDIQTKGVRVAYTHATLFAQNGQRFQINKRVNSAYEIQTNNQADINKTNYLGDSNPTHYPSDMRIKSFSITMFDDQELSESLLGTLVYYADNFGNGGWCMVTAYDKTDNFVKNSQGVYANEVSLTLEVTNYDDSIEYPI